jgi:hypothetical protein
MAIEKRNVAVTNVVDKPKKKKRKVTTVPQFNSTKKLMDENKKIRSLVANK